MGVDYEGLIVATEVGGPSYLYLHHLESLPGSSSAHIDIEVSSFYIQNNELSESISSAKSLELIFPIINLVYLVSLHRKNINYMNES